MRPTPDLRERSILFLALLAAAIAAGFPGCRESVSPPAQELQERTATIPTEQPAVTKPAARWEDAIARFEAQDRENPPPKEAVLFVGSSSIRLWDLARSFPATATINRGFGGSQVSDVLQFASRIVIPYRPRIIFFYAGDNDIAAGKSADRVLRDFNAFVQAVQAALPETRIVFIAIKPSLARWHLVEEMRRANRLVHDLTMTDERLEYIDIDTPMIGKDGKPQRELFAEDGLHLNERGYELWTELVKTYLE